MAVLTKKICLFSFISLAISSCASENIFLTDHKDGWFKSPDRGLVYCRANVKEGGVADPICFEAAVQIFENKIAQKK